MKKKAIVSMLSAMMVFLTACSGTAPQSTVESAAST